MGCYGYLYCKDVVMVIQYFCNVYFVIVFCEIIDCYLDECIFWQGLIDFNSYLYCFGMGFFLGFDFLGEKGGNVLGLDVYDWVYVQEIGWKLIWLCFLGIGQGELLSINLQLVNMVVVIVN